MLFNPLIENANEFTFFSLHVRWMMDEWHSHQTSATLLIELNGRLIVTIVFKCKINTFLDCNSHYFFISIKSSIYTNTLYIRSMKSKTPRHLSYFTDFRLRNIKTIANACQISNETSNKNFFRRTNRVHIRRTIWINSRSTRARSSFFCECSQHTIPMHNKYYARLSFNLRTELPPRSLGCAFHTLVHWDHVMAAKRKFTLGQRVIVPVVNLWRLSDFSLNCCFFQWNIKSSQMMKKRFLSRKFWLNQNVKLLSP